MFEPTRGITVLMADDDPDDRLMTREAWTEARLHNELRFVTDGEELMDYLKQRNRFAEQDLAPRPDLILLDLNMPRKDGRTALKEIRADPSLRHIPVVVLTTSKSEEDVLTSYDMGANSYIVKPVTFAGLVDALRVAGVYWLQIVDLPQCDGEGNGQYSHPHGG